MPYQPREQWKTERTCKRPGCGKSYLPTAWNQKYCCLECKATISSANFKRSNPEYWVRYFKQRKKDNTSRKVSQAIPWNPNPCGLCKRPLGETLNRHYHPNCLHRVTLIKCGGMDEYTGASA